MDYREFADADINEMLEHWANTPENAYLGLSYGGENSLLKALAIEERQGREREIFVLVQTVEAADLGSQIKTVESPVGNQAFIVVTVHGRRYTVAPPDLGSQDR